MNKLLFTKCASFLLATTFVLSSCMEKDVYQGGKNKPLSPTEVFDFSLTKEVKLNIDYGFSNDYYIIFDLYEQDPLIEQDGSWVKDETLTPLYSASTNTKGKYSGTISLNSGITEVWLYSDYLGVISPVKLSVTNDEIIFNQNKYIASLKTQTKGMTVSGYKYLDDWKVMPNVDWDILGYPTNIEPELSTPPADVLYSIKDTYSKISGKKITDRHKNWLNDNSTSELKIIKDTEVSLVFIASGAGWHNSVGYFTYKTNTSPTEANIKKILAFPNVSPISKLTNGKRSGSLLCGNEVKLKYWNEEKNTFEDKFPAGVTIGWSLQGMGFNINTGEISKGMGIRYSYNSMNSDKAQRVVALRHKSTDQIVAIGFEDNNDYDYCDATFYVKIAESGAISTDLPELPTVDPPQNVTSITKGTLAFEDQWPSQGDYDMNDVIIEYTSTLHKNVVNDKIFKIVDEFTPIHNGGTFITGFGYQLNKLESQRVRKIEVTGSTSWKVEDGHDHPTIILYDNLKNMVNKKITVTIDLADVDQNDVKSPYNPFIFVNGRSKEVHLVNYPPTNKADVELFNTEDDVSNTTEGIYYISRYKKEVELMPYCINIPTHGFKYSMESVKIYETYPKFIDWVESNGKNNTYWYK